MKQKPHSLSAFMIQALHILTKCQTKLIAKCEFYEWPGGKGASMTIQDVHMFEPLGVCPI
jgi:hypothetical protein